MNLTNHPTSKFVDSFEPAAFLHDGNKKTFLRFYKKAPYKQQEMPILQNHYLNYLPYMKLVLYVIERSLLQIVSKSLF